MVIRIGELYEMGERVWSVILPIRWCQSQDLLEMIKISSVIGNEPADLAGLSAMTKGFLNDKEMVRWCITEINNQPISLSAKKNEVKPRILRIVILPANVRRFALRLGTC